NQLWLPPSVAPHRIRVADSIADDIRDACRGAESSRRGALFRYPHRDVEFGHVARRANDVERAVADFRFLSPGTASAARAAEWRVRQQCYRGGRRCAVSGCDRTARGPVARLGPVGLFGI